jgi:hypothetical protein
VLAMAGEISAVMYSEIVVGYTRWHQDLKWLLTIRYNGSKTWCYNINGYKGLHLCQSKKKHWVGEAWGFDETQERGVMSKSLETTASGWLVCWVQDPHSKRPSYFLYSYAKKCNGMLNGWTWTTMERFGLVRLGYITLHSLDP